MTGGLYDVGGPAPQMGLIWACLPGGLDHWPPIWAHLPRPIKQALCTPAQIYYAHWPHLHWQKASLCTAPVLTLFLLNQRAFCSHPSDGLASGNSQFIVLDLTWMPGVPSRHRVAHGNLLITTSKTSPPCCSTKFYSFSPSVFTQYQ